MRPILFELGGFSVPSYGVFYLAAFLTAIFFGAWLGHRSTGIRFGRLVDLAFLTTIGGEIGARGMFVVVEWDRFAAGEISGMEFLVAGRVVLAGIVAGSATFLFFVWKWKLPISRLFDALGAAVPLGMGVGRIGCWMAGCCYGKPTAAAWGITFVHPLAEKINGTPLHQALHPTQPLQAVEGLFWFGVLWWLHGRRRFAGQVIATMWMLTGVSRFLMEFLRGDRRGGALSLATSQWIALATIALGVGWYVWAKRRAEAP